MDELKWYIVYTRPGEERKLMDLLTNKGIQHFCPFNKSNQRWRDRKHTSYRPLFPRYIFVYLNKSNLPIVGALSGVINFVFWRGEFAEVPEEEITAIRNFFQEYSGIKLEKTAVDRNDHVRVIYGPLVVREGDQFEVRNSPVSVILPSMGQILIAQERNRTGTVKINMPGKSWFQQKQVS